MVTEISEDLVFVIYPIGGSYDEKETEKIVFRGAILCTSTIGSICIRCRPKPDIVTIFLDDDRPRGKRGLFCV